MAHLKTYVSFTVVKRKRRVIFHFFDQSLPLGNHRGNLATQLGGARRK